jgi:hypothetical protein
MELTHKNLCNIAVKWLKRPNSNGGHGCHVAVSEVASGWSGEIPDSIGFRATGDHTDGSIVVEIKVSRSDFLADKKKPHRNGETIGLGNWRYYMCPVDLIKVDELPENFGLLYVNKRGHVKPIVTPFLTNNYNTQAETLNAMKFVADVKRESFLMIRLLSRIGDVEKLNNSLKDVNNNSARLVKKCNETNTRLLELQRKYNSLKRKENI